MRDDKNRRSLEVAGDKANQAKGMIAGKMAEQMKGVLSMVSLAKVFAEKQHLLFSFPVFFWVR